MNTKLDTLKAKHAAELATAEREESIRALLPIKGESARIMIHYGQPHAYYEAESLGDALGILRAFETAPFVQLKGTFLHHKPLEWIKERDREHAKSVIDCMGAMLTIDGGKGFGPTATLTKWARLENGELIEVQVKLGVYPSGKGFPAKWYVRSDVHYNRHGEVTQAHHEPPRIASDLPATTWGGGSRDGYRFSWVWCEAATFDLEMERYQAAA